MTDIHANCPSYRNIRSCILFINSLEEIIDEITFRAISNYICILTIKKNLAGQGVIFELIDFDTILRFKLLKSRSVTKFLLVSVKANFVNLGDITDIENSKAALKLIRELCHILFIGKRENHSSDLVILASCKLLADSSDSNYFTKGSNLTCHCNWGNGRLLNGNGN